jgi:putative oxidoreductase|tara:strand:- start:1902 stop:2324 length:423 start_codon:yes stop_codon:yes gene_type:complete
MEKLNNFLEKLANPLMGFADWIIRIGLGVSFFLHGFGKLPVDASGWLASNLGYPVALMVAWGEVLAGLGVILGGLLSGAIGNLITRLSGGAIGIIMIGAITIAHSNWGIFFGERGSVLFASEQLFLLLLGIYFAIKGNQK